jgi:hypothetical protein
MADKQKPSLSLAQATEASLIALSKKFTGRDPTPEELARAKASLARLEEYFRQPPSGK